MRRITRGASFDHLVGAGEQGRRKTRIIAFFATRGQEDRLFGCGDQSGRTSAPIGPQAVQTIPAGATRLCPPYAC
jgi:hypothetical protein